MPVCISSHLVQVVLFNYPLTRRQLFGMAEKGNAVQAWQKNQIDEKKESGGSEATVVSSRYSIMSGQVLRRQEFFNASF